jgi:hypothetical protein
MRDKRLHEGWIFLMLDSGCLMLADEKTKNDFK